MLISRIVGILFSLGAIMYGTATVSAQPYPNRPVRIVTVGIGDTSDVASRLIAQEMSAAWGQPVIVENRGGGGSVSAEIVSNSSPDGHTLLVASNSFVYGPLLQKLHYDPVKDFSPIAELVRSPSILIVHPSLPVKSVKELIALAKAKPGTLNYSSGGTGGAGHLTGELFKSLAGVNIVRIPYKGSALQMNALMAGEVQMMFENPSIVIPLAKAGKLRALAVTTPQPTSLAPGLPTVADSLPGFEAFIISAMFAPAKTPVPLIKRLNQEVVRALNQMSVKEKLVNSGLEVVASSPEELASWLKADMARMGAVIKNAGIKL